MERGEKDSKREKRKHKDKEKDKDKEARREERRKRRELKEMKKAEKVSTKEREIESLQNGEDCGDLLKEVSQKLLALEKEQQCHNRDLEDKCATKSQLDVIPPSSLLSGINDERNDQLQILQQQRFQQQERLREQQRLEQEKIDEQKMLHQQQKWLFQNEVKADPSDRKSCEEIEVNTQVNNYNVMDSAKTDVDVKATVTLTNGNVSVWQEPESTTMQLLSLIHI